MTRKHYTVDEVIKFLSKRRDCRCNPKTKVIEVLRSNGSNPPRTNDLGNKSWGRIDFLVKYNDWTQIYVQRFSSTHQFS